MSTVIDTLAAVRQHPMVWALLALFAALTLRQAYWWLRCPILHGRLPSAPADPARSADLPIFADRRHLLTMLFGISAALAGLAVASQGEAPVVAFVLVVGGVYVIQTAPARLRLREAESRIAYAALEGPEAREAALDRLRFSHLWVIGLNFLLLAGVTAALLAN